MTFHVQALSYIHANVHFSQLVVGPKSYVTYKAAAVVATKETVYVLTVQKKSVIGSWVGSDTPKSGKVVAHLLAD